jgi:hypothetical protein
MARDHVVSPPSVVRRKLEVLRAARHTPIGVCRLCPMRCTPWAVLQMRHQSRCGLSQRPSSSLQSDVLLTMVGPSKKPTPMRHRKSAKVVLAPPFRPS